MPVVYDNDRELVKITNIDALIPIAGADRIELAQVGGWYVIVPKGLHFVGEDILFFEVDACIPVDGSIPGVGYLANRSVFVERPDGSEDASGTPYHRLQTIRMRGVYSQGLILPWSEALRQEYADWQEALPTEGDLESGPEPGFEGNFATWLGVGKWERPVKANSGKPKGGQPTNAVAPFPSHVILKTDSERAQNLGKYWGELRERRWFVTEKVDGMSCTAFRDDDGELHVCSRNWELEDDGNTWWTVTKESGIADFLQPGDKVQFEIAGPGIQGNPLDLPEVRPFVFHSEMGLGRRCTREGVEGWWWLDQYRVPLLEMFAPWTLPDQADLIAQYDGLKSTINPKKLAEGVVLHTVGGPVPFLGRTTFKVISNKYLLKHDEKEGSA